MTKQKTILYLSTETVGALMEYQRLHRARFRSASAAADHLLGRALGGELDEGMEGLLAPLIERAVREATREEIARGVGALLDRQTNRLAGLLVKSGKDALSAYGVGVAVLERLTGDKTRAQVIARDARLKAGPAYSRGGLARGDDEG